MKKTLTFLFLLFAFSSEASRLRQGFEALAEYDYFRARKLFYGQIRKKPDAAACYGLSVIFARNDNPFHQYDSAAKYINLAYNVFRQMPAEMVLATFTVNSENLLRHAAHIGTARLKALRAAGATPQALNSFLQAYYLSPPGILKEALLLRDELEFDQVIQLNHSDSTAYFMLTHPRSSFYTEAAVLRERQLYDELTADKTAESYIRFILDLPGNSMVNTAYEKLFGIYRQNSDEQGLARFVTLFPKAPQNLEAWKLLFSLSVKAYSFSELKRFTGLYPAFPLKNSILHELELNKLNLYPYQKNDYTGFIDENGRMVIPPVYDAASVFSEGLSVVVKGDSVFFINKENQNPFNRVFTEASGFKQGIAPVRNAERWYFINRQGQTISGQYDEISELSNNAYVVKLGEKYGALDHFGQVLIEPRFDKLGDFKNGYAYFTENGLYGFVSKTGAVYPARYEWISDFDEAGLAIIRQNGRYGLVAANGKPVFEPVYDLVLKTRYPVYLLMAGNMYGFYSSEKCFITGLHYNYAMEKPVDFYTDGKMFKLLKKGAQALMDKNGHMLTAFGQYDELNFFNDELMLVKKKNKYGYVDRKFSLVIPYRYSDADDFLNGVAVVSRGDRQMIINTTGKELFASASDIERLGRKYFVLDGHTRDIITETGETVLSGVADIQKTTPGTYIVTLNSGEIKLIYD